MNVSLSFGRKYPSFLDTRAEHILNTNKLANIVLRNHPHGGGAHLLGKNLKTYLRPITYAGKR